MRQIEKGNANDYSRVIMAVETIRGWNGQPFPPPTNITNKLLPVVTTINQVREMDDYSNGKISFFVSKYEVWRYWDYESDLVASATTIDELPSRYVFLTINAGIRSHQRADDPLRGTNQVLIPQPITPTTIPPTIVENRLRANYTLTIIDTGLKRRNYFFRFNFF